MPAGLERINTRWGHSYKLDGQPCPGVTTLLKDGVPKPALMHWAARVVAQHVYDLDDDTVLAMKHASPLATVNKWKQIPFQQSKDAAARGTEVHGYAERLVKGWDVDVPLHLAGYVKAAVDFQNDWRIRPVLVEAVVASRTHQYCGTVDLIADLPDGRRALMDYKTTKSGIWPEAALQLAAYRHAEFTVTNDGDEYPLDKLGISCAYGVWLKGDGTYEVVPLRTDLDVFEVFLSAARTAKATKTMKSWIGEPETWKANA